MYKFEKKVRIQFRKYVHTYLLHFTLRSFNFRSNYGGVRTSSSSWLTVVIINFSKSFCRKWYHYTRHNGLKKEEKLFNKDICWIIRREKNFIVRIARSSICELRHTCWRKEVQSNNCKISWKINVSFKIFETTDNCCKAFFEICAFLRF